MLNWFARRLKEAQEKDKTGQGGFTLIELLVVVIIIGILAAIAIPTFLSQRERAQNASAESDLRNAAAAATSCFAANNGSYAGPPVCNKAALEANHGFNETADVTVTVGTPTADTWSATASHSNTSGITYSYNSNDGEVVEVAAPAPTP